MLHFHASENDRDPPDSGHVNWPEVREALRAIARDEVVSVEWFVPTISGG